jgi:hypothetical protein
LDLVGDFAGKDLSLHFALVKAQLDGHISDFVLPLLEISRRPNQQQFVDASAYIQILIDDDKTGAGSSCQESREVRRHGTSVVRNQDAARLGGDGQHFDVR